MELLFAFDNIFKTTEYTVSVLNREHYNIIVHI